MEHHLYICDNYSAKIWALAGRVLTLALSRHTGEGIPAIILTPLEIVFNKPNLSLLSLKLAFRQAGAHRLAGDVSTGVFGPIVP
jgi:hypothetical protein